MGINCVCMRVNINLQRSSKELLRAIAGPFACYQNTSCAKAEQLLDAKFLVRCRGPKALILSMFFLYVFMIGIDEFVFRYIPMCSKVVFVSLQIQMVSFSFSMIIIIQTNHVNVEVVCGRDFST